MGYHGAILPDVRVFARSEVLLRMLSTGPCSMGTLAQGAKMKSQDCHAVLVGFLARDLVTRDGTSLKASTRWSLSPKGLAHVHAMGLNT